MLFLLILIAALIFQFFSPWWIIVPIAYFLSLWKGERSGNAFFAGFFAILLLWIIKGLLLTIPNENRLANRVGQLLKLPDLTFNWVIVLLITGFIGGLVAGFAALAGFHTKKTLSEKKHISKTSG